MWKWSNQYTRGPWALKLCLRTHLAIDHSSRQMSHIHFFYPRWVEVELIFALSAVVSEIQADFENCHIWAWNLAIGQSFRSCTYILFLPNGVEIELILALRAWLLRYWPIFKISIFGRETWPLAKVPQIAHIRPKLPTSAKFHSILLYGWPFPRY